MKRFQHRDQGIRSNRSGLRKQVQITGLTVLPARRKLTARIGPTTASKGERDHDEGLDSAFMLVVSDG